MWYNGSNDEWRLLLWETHNTDTDISDAVWDLLKPLLPGQEGQWGHVAKDNRTFVNEVFWEMRTRAP
ncbi:MAG TPA: hypothetical protein DEQ02_03180 [Ruminococcaceae bacterium]|nr:hypothetical protein [Oscillospiraceae bacterium]